MKKTFQNARKKCLAIAGPFRVFGWSVFDCGFARSALSIFGGLIFSCFPLASMAQDLEGQDTVATNIPVVKLNTTGRTIQLPVPLKDGDKVLGEVSVRIDADDGVSLPKSELVLRLKEEIDAAAMERLSAVGDGSNDLTLEMLAAAGFKFEFDRGLMELKFLAQLDQRGETDLSLGGHRVIEGSSVAVAPAQYAGYLNIFTGLDHNWGGGSGGTTASETGFRFDAQAVMRANGFVLENDFLYEGPVDPNSCPVNAYCVYDHQEGFKRRATRLVYDRPEDRVRVQLGDTDTLVTGAQNSPALLGLSVEKSHRKLAPSDNIRPTGSHSFQIVRPSEVDVLVNGAIVRQFRLRPGSYNLRDLPLGVGANEVELVIRDDAGNRETMSFTQFFDHNLMAAGQSEWAVSGGVTSALVNNEREYRDEDYFGSGFIRLGLTDEMTGESHIQADARVLMGGFGVFRATAWGAFGLEASASTSESGVGYAATASWSASNFEGPAAALTGLRDSFYLSATYQSDEFRKPGEYLVSSGDILYPQYPYWFRASANYTSSISPNIVATLSGRFQLAIDDPVPLSQFTFTEDRYGVDLTLSASLTSVASASLTFGYSNEFFHYNPNGRDDDKSGEFRVFARVYLRPDSATRIATTYDTLNDALTVTANRDEGRGIGRWATSVNVYRNGYDDGGAASTSASYFGNRAEVQVTHRAGLDQISWDKFNTNNDDQRTSLRVGTAIAFADGKFAVGAPIKGDAFAIVHPHKSLAGKTVEVRSGDDVRAVADGFGPALVSQIPVYTDSSLPVDVADLPIGYSLGAGAFDLRPSYESGHVLEVGSNHSVTVYGTLRSQLGEPVGLVMGEAYRRDDPQRRVEFFTNSKGKFAAEGLSPGQWVLEAATEHQPTVFDLDVPEGTEGLLRTGELKPTGRS